MKIEQIRYIDIIAGIVVIACLVLIFLGRDGEIMFLLIGVLAAQGIYRGTDAIISNKNKRND